TGNLVERLDFAMRKHGPSETPCLLFLVQIDHLAELRKRRPEHVINGLFRELFMVVRQAVHPSQFVGYHADGVGVVLEATDPGNCDRIANRLVSLARHVIREGKYNDLTSRWTDILFQFLSPGGGAVLTPSVGWAVFPRDGNSPTTLINRATRHIVERRTA